MAWIDSKIQLTPLSLVNDRSAILHNVLDGADEVFLEEFEILLDFYVSERILDAKEKKAKLPHVAKNQKKSSDDK